MSTEHVPSKEEKSALLKTRFLNFGAAFLRKLNDAGVSEEALSMLSQWYMEPTLTRMASLVRIDLEELERSGKKEASTYAKHREAIFKLWAEPFKMPALTAKELLALADKRAAFKQIAESVQDWDFLSGRDGTQYPEAGKIYEAKIWYPGRLVSRAEEQAFFKEQGYVGNTAAFLMWCARWRPSGYHQAYVTAPSEDNRLHISAQGEKEMLTCVVGDGNGALRFLPVDGTAPEWEMFRGGGMQSAHYVAFREVKGVDAAWSLL